MADKKCPKCGLWNSEAAEVCDCGYNFKTEKVQYSISKRAEYEKLFRNSGLNEEGVRKLNRVVLLKIFLSLTAAFALIFTPSLGVTWISIASLLLLGVIIVINLYDRNKYVLAIGLRIWKYPMLGILVGYLVGFLLQVVAFSLLITFGLVEKTKAVLPDNVVIAIKLGLMYGSGLIGLWIGKQKIMNDRAASRAVSQSATPKNCAASCGVF